MPHEQEQELSPARRKLMLETVRRIRAAWERRERDTAEWLAKYDQVAESDDEDKLQTEALTLLLMVSLADPVRDEVQRFVQLDRMLKEAEADNAA